MEPFYQDQVQLARDIARVVGAGRVTLLGFFGSPLRGVRPIRRLQDTAQLGRRTSEDLWEYVPPPHHTPVAVLSDLGSMRELDAGGPAWPLEWHRFASRLQGLDCPVVAFVPFPRNWGMHLTPVHPISSVVSG